MATLCGSDSLGLLQEANQLADELSKFMKPSSKASSQLPFVIVPDGGTLLHVYEHTIQYPVSKYSSPQAIEHHHKHKNLIELPVLQQNRGTWEGGLLDVGDFSGSTITYSMAQLQRADGLNCGYHALKNIIYMLAACKKLELDSIVQAQELLYRMQDIPSFTQLLAPWLRRVIPYRYTSNKAAYDAYPRGNFPVGLDLEKILGEGGNQPLIPHELENLFEDGLHEHVCILDSFVYLKDPLRVSNKALQFLEKMITKQNGIYGFVVNDSAAKDLSTARGSHWFGYVLWKKDGKSIWLYTDSSFSRHDVVTDELIHICSQSVEKFNFFKETRVKSIAQVPFEKISSKINILNAMQNAYAFKFSCNKKCTLSGAVFAAHDFQIYKESALVVDDALIAQCNQLWQATLQELFFVSPREAEWQFDFWQKEKDASWKITYLDKKKSYTDYVYFQFPDGSEDFVIPAEIPGQIFHLLLKEPMDTISWNEEVASKVVYYMNQTIDQVVAHKKMFASEYDTLVRLKYLIFQKIQKDLGVDAFVEDKLVFESKLEQLLVLD